MELLFVSAVTFAAALLVGLGVRDKLERKDAYDQALAAFVADPDSVADPDQGWPRESRRYTSPPPPRPAQERKEREGEGQSSC